jgi:hypothetical protein
MPPAARATGWLELAHPQLALLGYMYGRQLRWLGTNKVPTFLRNALESALNLCLYGENAAAVLHAVTLNLQPTF